MKCLFDLSFIRYNLYAGVSKYAYRILDYIVESGQHDNYVLILNEISEEEILKKYPNFKYITIGSGFFKRFPVIRTIVLSLKFNTLVNASDCDIVFCPWGNEITCLRTNKKIISVIHDLQLRVDLKGLNLWIHKQIDDRVIRNSYKIVTISEFSRNQIFSFYPSLTKDFAVSLGNSVSMKEPKGIRLIDEKYLLYVGRICKMKNVITLIKSYAIIKDKIGDIKLVIVGKKNKYWHDELYPLIAKSGIESGIKVVEDCTEDDLALWYRDALLFVFPSMREGFGSPPIEAACMRTPVISTTCDSLEEVLMNKAFTYLNPTDEQELADKILFVLNNMPTTEVLESIRESYLNEYSIQVVGDRICNYIRKNAKK